MHKLLVAIALMALNFPSGILLGKGTTDISAASFLETPAFYTEAEETPGEAEDFDFEEVVYEEPVFEEPIFEEPVSEPNFTEENEPEAASETEVTTGETEIEKELTYDQMTQRGGDVEPVPVPPEEAASWYVEETAAAGLEKIMAAYNLPEFTFVLDSTPSNYVYQYEFYANSPDGGHVNLVGIFQYDATGNRTFQLDQVSGKWQ